MMEWGLSIVVVVVVIIIIVVDVDVSAVFILGGYLSSSVVVRRSDINVTCFSGEYQNRTKHNNQYTYNIYIYQAICKNFPLHRQHYRHHPPYFAR